MLRASAPFSMSFLSVTLLENNGTSFFLLKFCVSRKDTNFFCPFFGSVSLRKFFVAPTAQKLESLIFLQDVPKMILACSQYLRIFYFLFGHSDNTHHLIIFQKIHLLKKILSRRSVRTGNQVNFPAEMTTIVRAKRVGGEIIKCDFQCRNSV